MSSVEGDFQVELEERKHKIIPHSLINKSCIQRVSMVMKGMKEVPVMGSETQELNLSENLLTNFPLNLSHLKILILDHNCISRIPEQINQIPSLKHLSANHNQLTLLPFLKHLIHLQLNYNPIKLITSQLKKMKLQYLTFDWYSFLFCTHFNQEITEQGLKLLIEVLDQMEQQKYIEFQTLYELVSVQRIQDAVYRAISHRFDFFIEYLRDHHSSVNFNSMIFMDKLLLEYALKEDYEKGLELFMLKRSNLEDKHIFYLNLELACKYGHRKMFDFVYGTAMKRVNLWEKDTELAQTLIENFVPSGESSHMLFKILKYSKHDSNDRIVYKIPKYYSNEEAENIADAISFILGSEQLSSLFDFGQNDVDIQEPILHFSMANKHVKLLITCLEYGMNPFQKNKEGKLASNIRGSSLCRKILKKYEKNYIIKNVFEQGHFSKNQTKKNWLDFIFGSSPMLRVLKQYKKPKISSEASFLGYVLNCESKNISIDKLNSLNCRNSTSLRNYITKKIAKGEDQTGIIQDFILNSSSFKKISFREEKSFRKTILAQQIPLLSYEFFQNIHIREHKISKYKITLQKSSKIPIRICTQISSSEEQKENTKNY